MNDSFNSIQLLISLHLFPCIKLYAGIHPTNVFLLFLLLFPLNYPPQSFRLTEQNEKNSSSSIHSVIVIVSFLSNCSRFFSANQNNLIELLIYENAKIGNGHITLGIILICRLFHFPHASLILKFGT